MMHGTTNIKCKKLSLTEVKIKYNSVTMHLYDIMTTVRSSALLIKKIIQIQATYI